MCTAILAVGDASRSQRLGASNSEDVVDVDRHPLQFEPTQIEHHERRVVEVLSKAEAEPKSEVQSKDSPHSKHPKVPASASLFDHGVDPKGRELTECGGNEEIYQERMTFSLTTDQYGFETSWQLNETFAVEVGVEIAGGPPALHVYQDDMGYTGSMCLPIGKYALHIFDQYGDGICCGFGNGGYNITVGEQMILSDPNGEPFTDKGLTFDITGPTPPPTPPPTTPPLVAPAAQECYDVEVFLKVDKWGEETDWKLLNSDGVVAMSDGDVPSNGNKTKSECIPPGDYEFVITDAAHDGICCFHGQGEFKVNIMGKMAFKGGSFKNILNQKIKVGHDHISSMTQRDNEWLEAHNIRRKDWHENKWNLPYVPLIYSHSLADHAKKWADELLDDCYTPLDLWHEPNVTQGENLAGNKGNGGWGRLYSPDSITNRWVDFEEEWLWPANAHLTQALWRASTYMGCGESIKVESNGKICRRQVCRYLKAGNCAMNQAEWVNDARRIESIKQDDSDCGHMCPEEGCYVSLI